MSIYVLLKYSQVKSSNDVKLMKRLNTAYPDRVSYECSVIDEMITKGFLAYRKNPTPFSDGIGLHTTRRGIEALKCGYFKSEMSKEKEEKVWKWILGIYKLIKCFPTNSLPIVL